LCTEGIDSLTDCLDDICPRPAYGMIPLGRERDDLQLCLGRKLHEMGMQDFSEDWILFSAADYLNATSLQFESDDPTFLIELNLQVAERASSVAAYQSATKYLGIARHLLSKVNNPWTEYYNITLAVYQATVEAELCLGHFEVGMAAGQTLIGHAMSLDDKLPTYLAICRAFGRKEQHKEAYDMSVEILRMMGAIPKGGLGVMRLVKDLMYAKFFFASRHSDAQILAIPLLKDKRLETILDLWSVAEINAFYCGATLNHIVTIFRGLVISLRNRLSPPCGVSMTEYSLICSPTDDMKAARRFSHLSLEILDMTKARERSLSMMVAASFIHAWHDPPDQVIDLHKNAYKVGMESGDFQLGLFSQISGYLHAFITGHSPADLETKFLSATKKLRLYKVKHVNAYAEEQLLLIQYLRGTAEKDFDPTSLSKYGPTGTLDNVSEKFRLIAGFIARLHLAVYFNEDDLALHSLQGFDLVSADSEHTFGIKMVILCFSSLAYSTLYRKRRKKSYLKKSKCCLRRLERTCRIKGKVCWHRCMLMEAHLEAVKKGRESTSIPIAFDRAIEAASRNGYDHDVALGSQLAADYCMSVMQGIHKDSIQYKTMETLLRRYLQQATDLYRSWGAIALIDHLESMYSSLLIDDTVIA